MSAREAGLNKRSASKSCALSLVRQLFHLGVIEVRSLSAALFFWLSYFPFFIICKCQVNLFSSLLTNVICTFRPLPILGRRTVVWKAFLRTLLSWRQNWLHRSNQFRTVICQIKVCGMVFFTLKAKSLFIFSWECIFLSVVPTIIMP